MKPETALNLTNIRDALDRMEDTIMYSLIERAQFCQSSKVYKSGAFESLGNNSFLGWMLHKTEELHAQLRRYESPDENPFFGYNLPEPVLPKLDYPKILAEPENAVNVNDDIMKQYIENIVPSVAADSGEDPENYGSCTLSDIHALQAISRRIHFGKFVAESKYQSQPKELQKLIDNRDSQGILDMITKPAQEQKVYDRVQEKAEAYNLDPDTSLRWSQQTRGKVNPEVLVEIFKTCIIPLTKKVEVDYLLRRQE